MAPATPKSSYQIEKDPETHTRELGAVPSDASAPFDAR